MSRWTDEQHETSLDEYQPSELFVRVDARKCKRCVGTWVSDEQTTEPVLLDGFGEARPLPSIQFMLIISNQEEYRRRIPTTTSTTTTNHTTTITQTNWTNLTYGEDINSSNYTLWNFQPTTTP